MNFGLIRAAFTDMLRENIPSEMVSTILPRAPESVTPPAIWLGDGTAAVDMTMQQRIWDWNVPLNIAVANIKDYPREQAEAEIILAQVVTHIDEHYALEDNLGGTGIETFGLNFTSIEEGGIRIGNNVYAGVTMTFAIKCKFPLTLVG